MSATPPSSGATAAGSGHPWEQGYHIAEALTLGGLFVEVRGF